MHYANIKTMDVANGSGVRVSLFVSGCTHACKGCFNEIAWNFNYGKEFTNDTIDEILKACSKPFIEGLSLLGGEPMHPRNQKSLLPLILEFKKRFPKKSIWCYSGYIYETELKAPNGRAHCEVTDQILENLDILVDGKFEEDLKDLKLKFRGSSNQRIIDLKNNRILKDDEV